MKKIFVVLALAVSWAIQTQAQEKAPLRLVETVSVPGLARKWDHFGVDLKGHRLFVTSEDEPAVEVFDLQTNKHLRSLTEFKEPHNVLPFPEMNKIIRISSPARDKMWEAIIGLSTAQCQKVTSLFLQMIRFGR